MSDVEFRQWFHSPAEERIDSGVTAKLFCFPYAGGAPSAYHGFCRAMPAHVLPYIARLPGREETWRRPALTDVRDIIRELARAIRPALGAEPVFFWGHSMGALVAFEMARLLKPHKLIVSGIVAPQSPRSPRQVPVAELSDERFIRLLQSYEGIPQVILENPDLLSRLLPQLRADFMALDSYVYTDGAQLDCDIVCVNGESDRLIDRDQMLAWGEQTTGGFSCEWLPGGHFFINESRSAMVGLIAKAIENEPVRLEATLSRED
jgi:surfactin synthase thioesterase subunit